ncbi:MAG TPA: NUDIX hydrolase [Ktedonosporobacter sp.]|nr:NUDIX hydrolase [Ktedonosporobacter sp.]
MGNYIQWIREKVGHERIFLNFAAAFVLNEAGQLLLQKRGDKHAWGLPGGALELGESAEEAMIREVWEETGLHVKVEAFLGTYTQYFEEYPNGDQAQTIAIFFICSILGGELQGDSEETLDLQFFAPENAPALFNQQSRDAFTDFMQGRRGLCR